ncbi:retrovirus-related pol polyprotein from transposon TNT 1-94 [Tanacetum coccineum]
MQDKNIAISELKKLIENCKGKSVETQFNKPSVVRQPNAQRIPKPSVLGKPTPFSNSPEMRSFQTKQSVNKTNVSDGLFKQVTQQNLPQIRKQAVRNTNVIAPGPSRNCPKHVSHQSPREKVGSNDMVHNYYLEKAKKSAQLQKDKEVNGKPSMIDPARLPNTANGCKPKPRNWQASMSSRVSNKDVHLGEHRKQKPFLKFNDLQCPTCKKCLYSENQDECVLEYLSKLNPHASAQIKDAKSHNTTKRYVPIEKTSESKKPKRLIPKGHRFSHKKTTAVPEKTRTPRSCLRWQPTGRILKTVCLRWVPTGKLLNFCTISAHFMHANKTLGLSAGKNLLSVVAEISDISKKPAPCAQNVRKLVSEEVVCSSSMQSSRPNHDRIWLITIPTCTIAMAKGPEQEFSGLILITRWLELESIPMIQPESVDLAMDNHKVRNSSPLGMIGDNVAWEIYGLTIELATTVSQSHHTLRTSQDISLTFLTQRFEMFIEEVADFLQPLNLEVAFRKSTCYVCYLKGNDLLIAKEIKLGFGHSVHLPLELVGTMWVRKINRVESINGKKYVLVIVDDYSRYTWTHFLRSKNRTPAVLIDFLTFVQRGLHAQVRTVRTDKGMEFMNKTLHAYFAKEGIRHETSTARTPEQNGIVKRWTCTLVEAAQTMLSAAKVPLFFWAEAITTVCFTQNHSLVIPRHEKTPYHIINSREPSVKFFHIFDSLCYIVKDGENLDKMKEKGDACIFLRYYTQSRAYRVFNKRTRVIVETIHVNFDELSQMASDYVSSDPVPQCLTTVLKQDSLSPGPQSQENVPQSAEIVTMSNELDLLFSLMFDELLNETTPVVSKSSVMHAADAIDKCQHHNLTQSSTTTVVADVPPLNIQTTPQTTNQAPIQVPTVTANENIIQAETN